MTRFQVFLALVTLAATGCGDDATVPFLEVSGSLDYVETAAPLDVDDEAISLCPDEDNCDDGLECTRDTCLAEGGCTNILRPGYCLIDKQCAADGEAPSGNPCLECITAVAVDEWTANNSNSCQDNDTCTLDDRCQSGACIGDAMACADDGNPCTESGCQDGQCVPTNVTGDCDDGDACTDSYCDAGVCMGGGGMVDCEDGNECTTDTCHPQLGCTSSFNDTECDDGNPCTVGDACGFGSCQPGKGKPDCGDGNQCTDDSCHPVDGCMHFPNVGPCDDGEPCMGGDFCLAGQCQAGPEPGVCNDDNPCTDDTCEPGVGCQFVPNQATCDDGDICFADDQCSDGECQPGVTELDCDDSNVCTADTCTTGEGCAYEPAAGACDDADLCTENDQCGGGNCQGEAISCDDNKQCTQDSCDPETGCLNKAISTPECRPKITLDYPPRGATIQGDPVVPVTGTVTSPGGELTTFTVNGEAVAVAEDGTFAYPLQSAQGLNLIMAAAEDALGSSANTSPSFYFSTSWYAIDAANPAQSMVPDGIMIFMGPEVWDDNDDTDVDDMATIMTFFMQSLDLASLISNPVTSGTQGWCGYEVHVKNMTYGSPSIDLAPIEGGLHMFVTIPDFKADVDIKMSGLFCPSMSGKVTATSITIDTNVMIAMNNGLVEATLANNDVKVNGLSITIDGLWGFLLNWLVDFFEDGFATQVEASFEKELGAVIPGAIVDALNSLALDQDMEIKPFLGEGEPVTIQLKTGLSSVDFKPEGATLGLNATAVAPKVIEHNPLGSIGRASCLSEQGENFAFPMDGQLEMGLHDDFFNQLPFGMYFGGLFQMQVSPEELGTDLSQYGLDQVDMTVDFLLPPILTSCTPDGVLVLQIGDMRVDTDMNLYGLPVAMTMYASMEVEAALVPTVTPEGQKQIAVELGEVRIMEVEITEITGQLAGAEAILVGLVKDNLLGGFLDSFAGGAFGSFPIPDVDLSSVNDAVPPGSKISLDLEKILRLAGYTVLSGNVQQ